MPRKRGEQKYLGYEASGHARTIVDGRAIYLGLYNSPEFQERIDELNSEWRLRQNVDGHVITIDDWAPMYLERAGTHYWRDDLSSTIEAENVRGALNYAIKLHGRAGLRTAGAP